MSTYNGSLTREQFLFREARIVARFVLEGLDDNTIVDRIYAENLFQYPTEKMTRNIVGVVLKRVRSLESRSILDQFIYGPLDLAKQINLYSIMRTNRLVKDFMVEVLGSKMMIQDYSLGRKDLNVFFTHLREQDEKVNRWSDLTIQKIKQVLVKFLIEVDMIKGIDDGVISPIYGHSELIELIKDNRDDDMLLIFNGVR